MGSNRGPAAAAENRAALLAAARTLFIERGYRVPLSTIASAAGVGQGVLYRHFPTRLDLAFAVFEDHFDEYAATARTGSLGSIFVLWRQIIDNLVTQTAFVDMVTDARRSGSDYDGAQRLRALLAGPLDRAIKAGRIAPDVTTDEIMLAIRMAYGIVRTADDATTTDQLRQVIIDAFPRLTATG